MMKMIYSFCQLYFVNSIYYLLYKNSLKEDMKCNSIIYSVPINTMSFSLSKIPFINTVTQEGYLVVKHFSSSLPFDIIFEDINILLENMKVNDITLIDNCGLIVKGSSLTHVFINFIIIIK